MPLLVELGRRAGCEIRVVAARSLGPLALEGAHQRENAALAIALAGELGVHATAALAMISGAFRNTPPYVHRALTGLSALSATIAAKDVQLARLFAGTRQITQTLSSEDSEFRALLGDGNLLLAELRQRQQAIHEMLTGTEALATQLSGLVNDNQANLAPTLRSLNQVTTVLENNQADLRKALALAGPYYSVLGNVLGNGRWFDAYLCGLIPKAYSPPAVVPAKGCIPPKPGGGG